ncbi:MAG: hypothetical protein AB9907_03395 [Flexilinea sp.]|jgi:hypothetical protein
MIKNALFTGLIIDEFDHPVEVERIGQETYYVVNDAGFLRHIPSEDVDRQILKTFTDQISGNEDYLSEQAASMMGQDDIFTIAILKNQMKNIDQQIDTIFESGIPEDVRAYLGMMGMKITINYHGEIINIALPSKMDSED